MTPRARAIIGHIERAIAEAERTVTPQPIVECCANCRFWVRGQRRDPSLPDAYVADDSTGECHRRAPVHSDLPHNFPSIPSYEWCGEHEPFTGERK